MTNTNSAAAASPSVHADLAFLQRIFERAAFIRAFEEQALELSRAMPPQIVGSVHLCAGQEVVPLAALAALADDDQVIATYRGHGWALAAGLEPQAVFDELCHRASGINGGRAGSAYLQAPHTRFIGENSIVGAGTTIACGVALANVAAGNGRVVIVSIGDGAMNQGSVHEALAFAAAKKLPVIFVCEHNGWSELTATRDMFPVERLARRALAYGMGGETLDGTDPIAVREAVAKAAGIARQGGGPTLLECRVPRLWGHYNRDIEHYRPAADKRAAAAQDPLLVIAERLRACGAASDEALAAVRSAAEARATEIAQRAAKAPLPAVATLCDHVYAPVAAESGQRVLETCEMTYIAAVNAALAAELEADPRTVVYGEDVGRAGGIFGAAKHLQKKYGEARVFDTPIAENAILGSALGAALAGLKPVVEIMWSDFVFVAFDQLINQASNVRYLTNGRSGAPLVVRMQQGVTPGSCAQHSQSIEALLAHIPGLKLALAATPDDAYQLLRAAAADPDPCVVIEARGLYQLSGPVRITEGAEPVGRARLHRRGSDALVLTWGAMLHQALAAAEALAAERLDVAVMDLRWLRPLDEAAIADAVREAGGRVLIVHEAVRAGGFAAELAMHLQERMPESLCMPVRRLTTPDIRIPASPVLQAAALPNADSIARHLRALIADAPRPACR